MIQGVYLLLVVVLIVLGIMQRLGFLKGIYHIVLSGIALASVLVLRDVDFGVIDMIRYHIDYDDIKYVNNFWDALFFSNGKDPAYWGLTYIFFSCGLSYDVFVYSIALFDIIVYICYIKKYSPNYMLSNFVLLGTGCYTFMFYGLRQSISLATILLCINAWYNKEIIKTIFFLVISFLFHWSAICIIPFLFVSRLKFSNIVTVGYLLSLFIFSLFSSQIGNQLALLFSENYAIENFEGRTMGGLAIMCFLFLFWYVFVFYKEINSNFKVRFFLHGLLFLCMIQFCSTLRYSFTRLNFYYMFGFMTITIPMSFDYKLFYKKMGEAGKVFSICSTVVVLILLIYLFDIYIRGNRLGDYVFMWENIK